MTLNDLRERTKAAFAAFTAYRNQQMDSYNDWNMRQAWAHCFGYYEKFRADAMDGPRFREEYHRVVVAFARAGEDYYTAKKHGVDHAVLLKLSR